LFWKLLSLAVGYCSARYLSSIDQPLEVWIFRVNFCGLLAIVTGFVISFFLFVIILIFTCRVFASLVSVFVLLLLSGFS